MPRKMLVAGNWKMNHGKQATRALLLALRASVGHVSSVDVVVAPVSVNLETAVTELRGTGFGVAAQNCYHAERGAFTGEIAPQMLTEIGVTWVIVGHSERRHLFAETNDMVNAKAKAALAAGLTPIVCVGETLEEREGGRTLQVVETEVKAALAGISDLNGLVLAYEPLWAIGTGKTATPAQAQEVHKAIRDLLVRLYDAEAADATRILYGGSIKPDNAADLFGQPDIDGGLVGGASLTSDSFSTIINAA